MIEVSHLTRRFGSLTAVDDVSFSLESGEVVGFLGPNGAGKTTTMRILTGYLAATSAHTLRVAGRDVLRESLEVRRHIGYLPESVPLYRDMRVHDMMMFQGRLHGMARTELKRRVGDVLERVGVLDRRLQFVGQLSRGLRQRVGLAVALLPSPEVLILDEPTSGLDPLQRAEVRNLIRELAGEHTVLLSSHILAEIESMSERVIVLRAGQVVADGSREELTHTLGGRGYVHCEAVVGDASAAAALLQSLPGVTSVQPCGRLGIHEGFNLYGEGDLREDVGALAAQQGWALRELSIQRPSLEELFAQLVLGGESPAPKLAQDVGVLDGKASEQDAGSVPLLGVPLEMAPSSTSASPETSSTPPASDCVDEGAPALGTPGQKAVFYSLNPFDGGASRDLSKPVNTGPPPGSDTPKGAPGPSPEAESQEGQEGGSA